MNLPIVMTLALTDSDLSRDETDKLEEETETLPKADQQTMGRSQNHSISFRARIPIA